MIKFPVANGVGQFEQQNKVVVRYNTKYKVNMQEMHGSIPVTKRKYLGTL